MLPKELLKTSAIHKLGLALALYALYIAFFLIGFPKPIKNGVHILVVIVALCAIIRELGTLRITNQPLLMDKRQKIIFSFFLVFFVGLYVLVTFQGIKNVISVFNSSFHKIINVATTAFCAGFFEEYLVRGLILAALMQILANKRFGYTLAGFGAAFIFGLLHLSNLTFQSPAATLQQVLYATVLGFTFAYLRIATNRLSLCIGLHTLIDFQPSVNQGVTTVHWGSLLIVFAPLLLATWYCLWQADRQKNHSKFKV